VQTVAVSGSYECKVFENIPSTTTYVILVRNITVTVSVILEGAVTS